MKIGVYNRYWSTCGGGEKHIGAIVEVLSRDHHVELISVEPVDWERIQYRLGLDLTHCTMKQWPGDSCAQLSILSSNYEIFINSTYGSSMKPRSPCSVYMCFFPHRVNTFSILRMRVIHWLRGLLSRIRHIRLSWQTSKLGTVVPVSGVFPVEQDGRLWLGAEANIFVSGAYAKVIRIPLWSGSYNGIRSVKVDGKEVNWHIAEDTLNVDICYADANERHLCVNSEPMIPRDATVSSDTRQLGACIDTRNINCMDYSRQYSNNDDANILPDSLRSYNLIISNSSFTSGWIKKRWKLPSRELPPPIDMDTFSLSGLEKEKIILSVGRFFSGGHNKKHKEIAQAFIKMRRDGVIPDGWRLVLAGSRHREHPKHIEYFEMLEDICRESADIEIRADLPFPELLELYRRAAIYWHAAGWGERVNKNPERFEHFGITTCEAMASGCVPIVFDAAGQREIVATSELGFRYANYKMLAQQMKYLTSVDPIVLMKIGNRARLSIKRYSREDFPARVREIFRGVAY